MNQVVLVTGSSGGIGQDVVRGLTARGDEVVCADLVAPVSEDGVHFLPLDVTDESACAAAVARVRRDYGRLDALIHAAGVLGDTPDPLHTPTTEFERVMRINASGTYSMTREAAQGMLDGGNGGTILLFSSVAAKEARQDYLPYNASKIAILQIMWSMAQILGPSGISVNSVCPGPVNTAMWAQKATNSGAGQKARAARALQLPMRRFAEPPEVTSAVLFLTDPANRYLTGVSLDVAGGAHLGVGT